MHRGPRPVDMLEHMMARASSAVTEALLTAISHGSGAERVMGLAWREGKILRVERRPPLATGSGKILHLHVTPRGGGPTIEQE